MAGSINFLLITFSTMNYILIVIAATEITPRSLGAVDTIFATVSEI